MCASLASVFIGSDGGLQRNSGLRDLSFNETAGQALSCQPAWKTIIALLQAICEI